MPDYWLALRGEPRYSTPSGLGLSVLFPVTGLRLLSSRDSFAFLDFDATLICEFVLFSEDVVVCFPVRAGSEGIV